MENGTDFLYISICLNSETTLKKIDKEISLMDQFKK